MRARYRKSLLSILSLRFGSAAARTAGKPSASGKAGPSTSASSRRPFQAVSIQCGPSACELSRRLSGRRFLSQRAPELPLNGCAMSEQCNCRYLKYEDRRIDVRRLADLGIVAMLFGSSERRRSKGRRSTDR